MRDVRTSLKLTLAGFVASLLTTCLLYSVLDGNEWFARSAGAVVLVAGTGALCRVGRFPWLLTPFVQVAAVLVYLTSSYASADAQSGWLPGKAALRTLGDRMDAGFSEIDTVTPPLTPSEQMTLIVVAGVALTALLVDLLAAGLRQTALAGLPLLALYIVPAAVLPDGLPGILFLLPAGGYLLLLITDSRERLLRWGVAVSGRTGQSTRSSGELGQMTRRIGVTVLSMSIVIPALAPRLSGGAFGSGGIGNDPDGGGTISTLNPLVTMRRDLVRPQDVDLMRVSTNSLNPDELYLRAVTLDTFDGEEWRAGRREVGRFDGKLPDPAGLPKDFPSQQVLTNVEVFPNLESDYVPMPFPATNLQIDGSWRIDPLTNNVVSRDGSKQISGKSYRVSSLDLDPQATDVAPALSIDEYLQPYLELPDDLPQRVKDLAQRETKGQSTVLGKAIALQRWFRDPNEFAYDLRQRPGTGKDAILAFLSDRRGYCEQFASTMAVMARYLGIPARVNVGFTPGTPADDGTRTISAHDAHAWPELYMPGVGWTRFEPTPGSAASNPDVPNWLAPKPEEQPQGSQGDDQNGAEEEPSQPQGATSPPDVTEVPGGSSAGENPDPADNCFAPQVFDPRTNLCTNPSDPWFQRWWKQELAVVALLLLLVVPMLVRQAMRRRRWHLAATGGAGGAAEWAWIELRDSAVDLGYVWPEARTPRQTSAELAGDGRLGTAGADALAMITQFVERVRYAPGGADGPGRDALRAAVEDVRRELGATAGRKRRLRALLLPRSVATMLGRVALRIRTRAVAARQAVVRSLRPRRA
jgi:hypothetical protein